MRSALAVLLAVGVAALLVGCLGDEHRTDELIKYKIEDHVEKTGKSPSPEEIAQFEKEAEEQAKAEAVERRKQALAEGAEGVGALASGNFIGGGLLLGGAILTFFGLRGNKTGRPVKA